MRFFHISDLHIGKQLYHYSLKEAQSAILGQIVERVREYGPDALLIAGDIFDKSVPSGEAYLLFDAFLDQLAEVEPRVPVLAIAGNHDSGERLQYAASFLEKQQIHIAAFPPEREGERLKKVTLMDAFGPVDIYLLPFTKPGYVRHLFPEGKAVSYDEAVGAVLEREELDLTRRNVLLSHQFYVAGSQQPFVCASEQGYLTHKGGQAAGAILPAFVGGIDSVDVSRVRRFDYVALGHLHGAQWIGRPEVRYCGTPLKYSVSEEKQEKSVTLVTLGEKGTEVKVETIPLTARQDVRTERGTLEEVIGRAKRRIEEKNAACRIWARTGERKPEAGRETVGEEGLKEDREIVGEEGLAAVQKEDDFVSITLTDEKELFCPRERLEEHYSHILEVRVDNSRTRAMLQTGEEGLASLDPMELFRRFYQEMQGCPMCQEEEAILRDVIKKAEEEEG